MMTLSYEQKQALQNIFLILADLFKKPNIAQFHDLQSGKMEIQLNNYLDMLSRHHTKLMLSLDFESFEEMAEAYRRCFLGPEEPYAPPIESLYKPWTTDPTAATPIAGQKGYFLGDSAVHMKYLYELFEIVIPKEYSHMPDHLTLLLEFLAFLIELGKRENTVQFINDHFNWLSSFKERLIEVPNSEFYVFLTDLVDQLVHSYLYELENGRSE